MRWSQAHIPTLRDDPAEAEAISHKLLVRAGFIRQLSSGHYSMLPMGQKVRLNIDRVIREEMDAIGGQQFHLPALHPAEIWKKSGRWEEIGDEMFRLVDRKGADNALGFTHEEVFALLASELTSYRQLPQIWYQIQTKFRDEPRPKSGVLRVREFTMKDSYSLDVDTAGLAAAFDSHHAAYERIFARLSLRAVPVEASSGIMGGSESTEFMVRSSAGEDWIVTCDGCDYAANVERATSRFTEVADPGTVPLPDRFATPGIRTIRALAEGFADIAAPERQIKTLVYVLDGVPTLVLMRGDHDLQDQKLIDATKTVAMRPAQEDEIVELLGARPGSLGAVGVSGPPIIADTALRSRRGLVTGANEDDWHLRDVDVDRDIAVTQWEDLRAVKSGEPCPVDGGNLQLWKGVEVGHIFKLGTRYSEAMGAFVQDEDGQSRPIIMGSYGIGLERAMATIVEVSNDDRGIVWPPGIGPWDVVITTLRADEPAVEDRAARLYEELTAAGISVIYDDRVDRPGVKFADAELIGIPFRVTIGPRGLESGMAEFTPRSTMETSEVPIDDCLRVLRERLG